MLPAIQVTDPDFFAKMIAFRMLGSSRYSLLGCKLRIKRGLVYSFRAGKYNSQLDPHNFIELHTSQPAETMKVFAKYCEHCKKYGFSRQDFERAQTRWWIPGLREYALLRTTLNVSPKYANAADDQNRPARQDLSATLRSTRRGPGHSGGEAKGLQIILDAWSQQYHHQLK